MKFNFFKILLVALIITSCEKDFASFDSGVINSDNAINFSTNSVEYSLTSRSEMVNPVQTNNLPSFLLGSYNCLLYTSPSPRDLSTSRMPSSA